MPVEAKPSTETLDLEYALSVEAQEDVDESEAASQSEPE